jgi:hypothetical protein
LGVERLPLPDGRLIYRLKTAQSGHTLFGVPNNDVKLIAPDGTEFHGSSNSIDRNSFAEIGNVLFGGWTATEYPTSGPENSYTITIAPFTINSFTEAPVILSPQPGSTVPSSFVVEWGFPMGSSPPSRALSYSFENLELLNTTIGVDGVYSVGIESKILQPGPASLSLRVGTQSFRPNPPIISRSSSLDRASITTLLYLNTYSLMATYHVVPEPSALVLACVLVTHSLCTSRWARRACATAGWAPPEG